MALPPPSSFNPELSTDRLQLVADWLLEEFYSTQDDLVRSTDSSYGRGCTTFDRQRNRIIQEAISDEHPWLGLENSTFDLVFTIGGVPCRFSNDDPSSPSKGAVLLVNRYQSSFMEFVPEGAPGRFCFVVDRGFDGLGEPRVEFLGFSLAGDLVCKWISDSARVIYAAGDSQPQPVEVGKPNVGPKRPEEPVIPETPEVIDGSADTDP